MYSPELLDHFQHPRNAGDLTDPDVSAQVENPACGDVLKLTLIITDGRISQVGFRAKGCVPAMACASALTELIKDKTSGQAAKITRQDVIKAVGGLPEASTHASHLAIDALAHALKKL
ncbi:MAG TPA: iron-sulfur cluster assembly scaffold protein [Terriglobales bacterium]|nr:iron-sulfur cluster assembly scaffold protein [Terriglobales bacterium]